MRTFALRMAVACAATALGLTGQSAAAPTPLVRHVGVQALALDSTTFPNGARMPQSTEFDRNGCTGGNASPELRWRGAPPGVRSFALTMHDPDAKAPGGWWHWIRFDIPARVHELRAGERGTGTDGLNSFGASAYGGPCPPPGSGIHHYHVLVYALDVAHVPATSHTDGPALLRMLHGHTLAAGNLVGTYSR